MHACDCSARSRNAWRRRERRELRGLDCCLYLGVLEAKWVYVTRDPSSYIGIRIHISGKTMDRERVRTHESAKMRVVVARAEVGGADLDARHDR